MNQIPIAKNTITFSEFLELIRFKNLFMMVVTQYLVRLFLIGENSEWLTNIQDTGLLLLSVATVVIGAAGYIINDYYDIKIDTINKPDKVVIGKTLKRRTAMLLHTVFNIIGIAIGLYLGWWVLAGCVVASVWLWFYSNQLKRLPFVGNVSVALLTVMAVEGVNAYYGEQNMLIHTFAIFAFFISVIREIIKDMEDLRGDMHFNCKTLPIVWGIRKSKSFIYFLLITFSLCTISMLIYINIPILNYYFIFSLIPIGYFVHKLYWADRKRDYKHLSDFCKWFMLSGILVMIFV
jgi:4-hydroxybenzoate polyprenyltransferase